MVVEFLTFEVPVSERAEWLQHEEQHWSRFLEQQAGYVRKEIWMGVDPHGSGAVDATTVQVHAVIWWESMAAWKAIPAAELAAVAEAMGPFERSAVCEAYAVIRTC